MICLDRDSGKWNLDPTETHKRRELFYELLTYDSWQVWRLTKRLEVAQLTRVINLLQSLTFGRPPSLSTIHIDSQLPHDPVTNAAGEVEMSCEL
jgi:hypothetical protein